MKKLFILVFTIFLIGVFRIVSYQYELSKLYSRTYLVKNGMLVWDACSILDVNIESQLEIRFNRQDTTYTHVVFYPPMWNMDGGSYFYFEFDPFTHKVVNFNDCE